MLSRIILLPALSALLFTVACRNRPSSAGEGVLLKDITLIDGSGRPARPHVDLLIRGGTVSDIRESGADSSLPEDVQVLDLSGKTVMPVINNTHGHLGILKGTRMSSDNYTRDNIIRQLEQYASYGVGAVLCMGTDQQLIFGLRDSSRAGLLPGARIYTAGFGFATPGGIPAPTNGMDHVNRPATPEEATAQVRKLAPLKPDVLKMWVEGHPGTPAMKPEVYKAIIAEAHRQGIRVAAHLYYLEDARKLVDAGVDIIAHSVRDKVIDDTLIAAMKQRGVMYIPTLALEDLAFIFADHPDWLNTPFFKAALEPGVWEMISNEDYLKKIKADPGYQRHVDALKIAMQNVKKLYDAGITITLGTDSGAQPVRVQGFSEHLEMELLVRSGIPPLQVIRIATRNGAELLHAGDRYGTLEPGKQADFIVLNGNPLDDITRTRAISSVWKAGKKVSDGPVQQ
ncbi:amidohydrolase family protein [Compostibacter hankyongensis]|uniref:Amidohydrolase family protein n=1 Tax=Compostibacter hankyongensis TaxID=1007089 RepID=A0ABP8G1V6_9BACT